MEKENLSRYEFLKSIGFRGAALMAVLTSCVHEEDAYVQALTVNTNGTAVANPGTTGTGTTTGTTGTGTTTGTTGTTTGTTGTGTTTGTTGTTTGTTATGNMTTDQLNAIKSPLLKIDLAASTSKSLLTVGGYIIQNNIVLAQVTAGNYAAVANLCTHEPKRKIIFNKTEWYCTDHGARFNTTTGSPLNTIARSAITVYKVGTDGKTVVVYS